MPRAILDHPAGARFFTGPQLAWSGNEVAVSDAGEVLRIDRLVRIEEEGGEPVWWVLDYKLRHAPEALEPYRQQLLRYRDAVARGAAGRRRCAAPSSPATAGGRDRLSALLHGTRRVT